jgi:hypothetical protein
MVGLGPGALGYPHVTLYLYSTDYITIPSLITKIPYSKLLTKICSLIYTSIYSLYINYYYIVYFILFHSNYFFLYIIQDFDMDNTSTVATCLHYIWRNTIAAVEHRK